MSDDEGRDAAALKVEAVVGDDRRSLMLRFGEGDKASLIAAINASSVDALIAAVGAARSQMLEPIPADLVGTQPITSHDPSWRVMVDDSNKFATFWIRHPGLGWSVYAFSRHEAANISKWLRKVIQVSSTRDTQSSAATSIEIDGHFITTEGLGFYYYGKGEKRIGANPFEQIEFDSDRAAGIVAGSIVEQRLEQAIRSKLRGDRPSISQNLFRPSGPLGPFSNKIQLSYLMGIISDEAYGDLDNLKNIRNDFAHKIDLDSFDIPTIRDRCKNFKIVDRHVGPVPEHPLDGAIADELKDLPSPYMGLPDFEHKIADPRFRYTMTAQLISYELGLGSESPDTDLPMI